MTRPSQNSRNRDRSRAGDGDQDVAGVHDDDRRAGPVAVATPSTPGVSDPGDDLPFTGGAVGTIVGIALALLAAGALARAASRRSLLRRR